MTSHGAGLEYAVSCSTILVEISMEAWPDPAGVRADGATFFGVRMFCLAPTDMMKRNTASIWIRELLLSGPRLKSRFPAHSTRGLLATILQHPLTACPLQIDSDEHSPELPTSSISSCSILSTTNLADTPAVPSQTTFRSLHLVRLYTVSDALQV